VNFTLHYRCKETCACLHVLTCSVVHGVIIIQAEINCCDNVCRGFDYSLDKVLLPVS